MLEWGIKLVWMDCIFQNNTLKPEIAQRKDSKQLAENLRNRFYFFGILGLALAPFFFVGALVYFFFKYGEQVLSRLALLTIHRLKTNLARYLGFAIGVVLHCGSSEIIMSSLTCSRNE